MRLCIISTSYPNEDGIGNTFVEQLVNAWARMGHHCIVISPLNTFKNNDAALYKEHEIKILDSGHTVVVFRPRIWMRNIPFLPVSTNRHLAQKAIERVIQTEGLEFDAIYCHFFASGIIAWHYARKHRIPLYIATGESTIKSRLQKPCLSFSWDQFRKDTHAVVCVSTKNMEECVSLGYAEREKCKVFPNGVNLKLFNPKDRYLCRKKLGFNDSDFITITVGEISNRKGQLRVIRAIDSLGEPTIKSIFIGCGEELPNRDYILFKGRIPHDDLPVYLSAADVFILPTLREGCCNAIVEAMACGLPIISSDRDFNHDILTPRNSILVDPNSTDEIAAAVKELFLNKKQKEVLSEGALKSSIGLSIDRRAENIMSFIQQTLE